MAKLLRALLVRCSAFPYHDSTDISESHQRMVASLRMIG